MLTRTRTCFGAYPMRMCDTVAAVVSTTIAAVIRMATVREIAELVVWMAGNKSIVRAQRSVCPVYGTDSAFGNAIRR